MKFIYQSSETHGLSYLSKTWERPWVSDDVMLVIMYTVMNFTPLMHILPFPSTRRPTCGTKTLRDSHTENRIYRSVECWIRQRSVPWSDKSNRYPKSNKKLRPSPTARPFDIACTVTLTSDIWWWSRQWHSLASLTTIAWNFIQNPLYLV